MSFATEIARSNSERFPLVRITPRRNITSQLASEGSGVYGMVFTYDIAKIERNGTVLTKVTSAPVANDRWYVDSSGNLDIKLASAPSSSNVIVVFYNLYLTTGEYRIAYKTPTDDTTEETNWEPRIAGSVSVNQSVRDVLGGVLASSLSGVDVDNSDAYLQQFFTDEDSWKNAAISLWLSVNGEIARLPAGIVQDVSLKTTATVSVGDVLMGLNSKATFGDPVDLAYFTSTNYPDVWPEMKDAPIPVQMAKYPAGLIAETSSIGAYAFQSPVGKATCISYDSNAAVTTNREWVLGKLPAGASRSVAGLTFGTITAVSQVTSSGYHFINIACTGANVPYNMGLGALDDTAGNPYRYGRVLSNSEIVPGYQYRIIVTEEVGDAAWTTDIEIFVDSITLFLVEKSDPTVAYFMEGPLWQGSLTTTTTTAGNKILSCTFGDDIENHASDPIWSYGGDPISPDTHDIYVYIHAEGLDNAVEWANELFEAATGLELSGDLGDPKTNFYIPSVGESEIGSYRSYLQKICQSVAGYIVENSSGAGEAALLAAPSAGTLINGANAHDFAVAVEYADIKTSIRLSNPQMRDKFFTTDDDYEVEESDTIAPHLHKTVDVETLEHILESIEHRSDEVIALKANRRAIYSFRTATTMLDADIGDDITLESDIVLGGSGTANLKIIGLEKSASEVLVEATDLLGL